MGLSQSSRKSPRCLGKEFEKVQLSLKVLAWGKFKGEAEAGDSGAVHMATRGGFSSRTPPLTLTHGQVVC